MGLHFNRLQFCLCITFPDLHTQPTGEIWWQDYCLWSLVYTSSLQKWICYFDDCNFHQNCNCWHGLWDNSY